MKGRIFLMVFWIGLCVHSGGQTVEWSNQQKLKSKLNYSSILGENASGYFLMRCKDNDFNRDLTIERYKSNLAQDISKELWQPQSSYIQRVILQPSGLMIFAIQRTADGEKYDMMTWRTDDNLNQEPVPKQLFEMDAESVKSKNGFFIKQTPDRSKFVIMYLLKGNGDQSVLVARGYNADLSPLYSRQYKLDFAADDVYISAYEIDNEANIFTLADFPKTQAGKKKSSARKFYLYGIYANLQDLNEYDIGGDTLDISDIGIVMNQVTRSVNILGLFRIKKEANAVDGLFYTTIDIPSTALRFHRQTLFDKNLVSKITATISNENSPGLSDLAIRKIIPRSDGGCLLLGEKFYETRQTYTYYVNGFPQVSSKTIFNYDEVIVLSINDSAEIEFHQVVKKRQSSVNDGGYYSSFVTANTNSSLALIYSQDASGESDVLISTITPKGEIDSRILIKSMSYYVALMPPESRQVAANVSLICALKDRKFSLMKVIF